MKKSILAVFLLTFAISACRREPTTAPLTPPPEVLKGVYVLNEGNYGDPAGARLSLYDVARDTVYKDVIESANSGRHLGSLGDDMQIVGNKMYIVMSGSENIAAVDLATHAIITSANFPGDAPHDIAISPDRTRAFVTRLYKNSLLVLNLNSLTRVDTIPVGFNPQGMLVHNNLLFVCNSGYGSDRRISVIEIDDNRVLRTLIVPPGPTSGIVAGNGRIWIACTGNPFGSPPTNGAIAILNAASLSIEDSIAFSTPLWGQIARGTDGSVYVIGITPNSYSGGPVHRIDVQSKSVTLDFVSGTFYSIAVDDLTGDIYLGDAKNFATDGEVQVYNKDGIHKKTFAAQKGPGVIVFKRGS